MPLLEIKNLCVRFGGLDAVKDYNLTLNPGDIRGLIGPNGAGKTTVFNLITGICPPTSGLVLLNNWNIVGFQPYQIAARGIGRTFQNLALWRHMTVLEHVKLACYSKITYGLMGAFFGSRRRTREEAQMTRKAMDLLALLGIDRFANQLPGNLPYGAQRRVEMARALATDPKLLLLDEPTAGMNPEELIQTMDIIRRVHREYKMAILLIEHRLKFVMELCEHIQCLVFGEVIAEGPPEEIKNHPQVIEAYLGKETVI